MSAGRPQGNFAAPGSQVARSTEPGQGFWPCPRSAGGSEEGGELRFPPSFTHWATPSPQPKEVHSPVAQRQNVFQQNARSTHGSLGTHGTCGHPESLPYYLPPHAAATLCPRPWLQSLFFAEILVATRNKNKWPALL